MNQKIASWLFLFTLKGIGLLGQYSTTAFYTKTYQASDGLPDSYILNIYQDKKEYLWIGTYSGLSRFDGTSFTNFGVHNGFDNLYISQFFEFDNRLWVSTRNKIGYFENNTFHPTSVNDGLNTDYIYGFGEVLKGKLWAFTSKGLYEWKEKVWIKKKYFPGLENTPIRRAASKDGILYFCLNDRIVMQYEDGKASTITAKSDHLPYFLSLNEFHNRLFINTVDGLYELKQDQMLPLFQSQLTGKTIYTYLLDSRMRFWIATEQDGILISDPGSEEKLVYQVPLSIRLVSKIFEDKGHNIWVASFQGMLKIKNFFFDYLIMPGTVSPDHRFLPAVDMKGGLYIYEFKSGLATFDGKQLLTKRFLNPQNILQNEVRSTLIDILAFDGDQNYWAITRSDQLFRINTNGKQVQIKAPLRGDSAFYFNSVAWEPVNKRMYCGGHRLYFWYQDSLHEFRIKQNNLPIETITKLLELKNGNILVNSRTSGVWLINSSGNAFNMLKETDVPIDSRFLFAEDNLGKIWIAFTGIGLKRYAIVNDTAFTMETEISTMNGLPNDIVETIAVDSRNRLWAATLSGLIVMDTLSGSSAKKFVMYHIGKEQNFNFQVQNGLTKMKADKNGDIWFCTNEHLIRFRSNDLDIVSVTPVTHIENMRLNMKETDWKQWSPKLDGYFMLPEKLELPHNQNTLTFSFKGINYNSDERIWYSYKLIGVDTSWGPSTENNLISYIKLSPGTFTFMVRTRNNNSAWSEPASFTFIIKPPFWKTWWFRTLGILLASFILFLIFRTQLKRVNKKAALQNQLRNLEMKALKAQMNPHFVYNALNSIQSLVIDNRQQEALDYMVKFGRLLRQVLNHSEQNVVTLDKELATLELYIQLEALRLHYSLDYSIDVDDPIIPEKEFIPPLILQPFVENALWHGLGEKDGDKNLTIHVFSDDQWLYCSIADNGVGRRATDKKEKSASYHEGPRGMEITTNRLKAYNDDKRNESIEVKDHIWSNGEPGGTTIVVKIRRK